MDKSEAIASVDDAIRKLVHLSSKEKIWTQEMLLQVNDQSLRLLDVESQEELENFPLPTVRHSQTVLNQLRYPSVLLLVCQDSDQSKPDVHFFHCDQVEVRRAAVLWARVPRSQSQPDTPAPPRQSWCTRTLRARWPTAGWERRCGRRP